jgi:hypothetical protein
MQAANEPNQCRRCAQANENELRLIQGLIDQLRRYFAALAGKSSNHPLSSYFHDVLRSANFMNLLLSDLMLLVLCYNRCE